MQAELPTKTLRFREIGDAHLCTSCSRGIDPVFPSWTDATKGGMKSVACFFHTKQIRQKKVVNEGGGTASNSSCRKHFSHIPMSNWRESGNQRSESLEIGREDSHNTILEFQALFLSFFSLLLSSSSFFALWYGSTCRRSHIQLRRKCLFSYFGGFFLQQWCSARLIFTWRVRYEAPVKC